MAAVTAALISEKHRGENPNWRFLFLSFFFRCKKTPKKRLHNSNISRPLTRKNLFPSPVFAFLARILSGSLWLFLCRRRPLQMSYYPPTERRLIEMTAEMSRANWSCGCSAACLVRSE